MDQIVAAEDELDKRHKMAVAELHNKQKQISALLAGDAKKQQAYEKEASHEQDALQSKHFMECVRAGEKINNDMMNRFRERKHYCTHRCLLGLIQEGQLDEACPNVSDHRVEECGNYHALDLKTLLQCMRNQMAKMREAGIRPLYKGGARGTLFKLTLDSHGYTFVGKGTIKKYIPYLEHEGKVYRHLSEINGVQGDIIPVYLGIFSLIIPYYHTYEGTAIVHMLLMSWAGDPADKDLLSGMGIDLELETSRIVKRLEYYGVIHGDIRVPNVLWNARTEKVMVIDFDRAKILNPKMVLQEISENRNRRAVKDQEMITSINKLSSREHDGLDISELHVNNFGSRSREASSKLLS